MADDEIVKLLMEVRSDVAELKARVSALEVEVRKRNNHMRVFMYMYILSLSLIAALAGVRWVVPS